MKKTLKIILSGLLLVIPSALILLKTATSLSFYHVTQVKYLVSETTGIPQNELDLVMEKLINYTKGTDLSLDFDVTINQKPVAAFNEREITHMVDVQKLYLNFRNLIYFSLFLGVLFLIYYHYKYQVTTDILSEFSKVTLALIIFVGFVAVFAWIDFYRFWYIFHELIFTNDLWLLDPNTDLLINLVPEPLFFSLVFKIIIRISSYIIISNLVVLFINRKKGKVYD